MTGSCKWRIGKTKTGWQDRISPSLKSLSCPLYSSPGDLYIIILSLMAFWFCVNLLTQCSDAGAPVPAGSLEVAPTWLGLEKKIELYSFRHKYNLVRFNKWNLKKVIPWCYMAVIIRFTIRNTSLTLLTAQGFTLKMLVSFGKGFGFVTQPSIVCSPQQGNKSKYHITASRGALQ